MAAGNRIRGRWCLPALASAGGSGEVRAGNRDLSQPCARLFLGDVSPQQWAWRKLGVSPVAPLNGAGTSWGAMLGCGGHLAPCTRPRASIWARQPPLPGGLHSIWEHSPLPHPTSKCPLAPPPPGHLPPCPQPRSHLRAGVKAAAQCQGQRVTAAPHRFVLPPLGKSTLASAPRHRVGHPQTPSTPLAHPGPPAPPVGAAS